MNKLITFIFVIYTSALFSNSDSLRISELNNTIRMHAFSKPDSAVYFANKALNIAIEINHKQLIFDQRNMLAMVYQINGDINKSMNLLTNNYEDETLKEYTSAYIKTLSYLGNIYYKQSNYDKALSYYLEALALAENLQLLGAIAMLTNNIGNCYEDMNQSENAIAFYLKTIEADSIMNNKEGMSSTYGNIGNVFEDDKKYEDAIYYHRKSIQTLDTIKNYQTLYNAYHNLAVCQSFIKQLDSALINNHIALRYAKLFNHNEIMAMMYITFSHIYLDLNQMDSAKFYLTNALNYSNLSNSYQRIRDVHSLFSKYYELSSDYRNSLIHHKLFKTYNDSIFNESKSKEIGKLEATYEMEKKQAEEDRLRQEQEKREQMEKERRDNIQYSIIFLLILIVFGSVLGLGFIKVSAKFAEGLIFFAFLIFFEFCLVILDPYIDDWSSGEPIYKLLFNAVLAGAIFPLHAFFENKLKNKILKS
jgi:tetratricopeptide (TPR) repeat protein